MKLLIERISVWRRGVFARALIFSILTLIPMLAAGGAVSAWSRSVLYDQIVQLNTSQTNAAMTLLRGELDKLKNMESELLFDKDINRLGVIPGFYTRPQSTPALLRVVERMRLMANSSTFVSDAMFLAPSIGKAITQDGVDTLDNDFYAAATELYIERAHGLIEIEGEYYLMMAYPTYASFLRKNGAMYLLGVKIDRQALDAFLTSLMSEDDESVMLCVGDIAIASVNLGALKLESVPLSAAGAFDVIGAGDEEYMAVASRDTSLKFTLIKLMPKARVFASVSTQRMLFLMLMLLIAVVNMLYNARLWRDIHKPLRVLSGAFERVEEGVLSTRIHHQRNDEFADIYERFNIMNERLEQLIEQMYKQTIRSQRAELKQLQSQINPHFLYNSFFMIKSFARMGDCEAIERMTNELGEYFRYVTRNDDEQVPLAKEVTHASNYAAIQDMRFSSRIKLKFPPLPADMEDITVPRLILQPLIENAYGHGLAQKSAQGVLEVKYTIDEGGARVIVEDSGDDLTDEALADMNARLNDPDATETTALINIHRRLQLRFGAPCGLKLTRSQLGGLKVILTVPFGGEARA